MQILAKFVSLREHGNGRPRYVHEIACACEHCLSALRKDFAWACDLYITTWALRVAYLEGGQCEKPAYKMGTQ